MQAILLAAGYATRLSPLTDHLPKALLTIGKETMLDRMVDSLLPIEEIERLIIITNDRFYAQFTQWADHKKEPRIAVLNDGTKSDEDKLGAIGDIGYVVNTLGIDEDCLIAVSDNYLMIDMQSFYNEYIKIGRKPLLLAKRTNDLDMLRRFGVASADENGRVTKLIEKPKFPESDLAVFGLYIYPRETMQLLPRYVSEGNNTDAPGHFPQWLTEQTDVYVHITEKPCYDIGTHETLALVRSCAEKGEFI